MQRMRSDVDARRYSRRSKILGAAACSLMLAAQPLAAAHAADASGPVVATADGAVQGMAQNGVNMFLGIPYAAPPVGSLRWQPPKAHGSWTRTRDATKFGGTCAQITELGAFAGPATVNEDCLYLNVFTTDSGVAPGRQQRRGATKRPVLLWIHGGGLVDGESNDYDASKLAQGGPDGPTVVVTINYRLGLLGYLAHPALDHEGHHFANYGLMDQQAALRWVRRNIAAFGGDPGNVTLGGQSAGSTSTGANVVSPLGAGLFHRAIFQSVPLLTVAPLDFAETRGTSFAAAAGCGSDATPATAACLRSLPVGQILTLQGTASANGPYVTGVVVDGKVLPIPADTAWATGNFNRVPIMNGTTQDEGAFTASINEYFHGPLTADQYSGLVTATYSAGAGASGGLPTYPTGSVASVLARYPANAYASPSLAYTAVGTDATACRARRFNTLAHSWTPVYAYEFRDRNAPWYFPPLSFRHGAAHTIDIQFLFPGFHGGPGGTASALSAPEEKLSDKLVAAWTNFMYAGDPNGRGLRNWPQYQAPNYQYLSEDVPKLSTFTDADFTLEHQCAFWDSVLVY